MTLQGIRRVLEDVPDIEIVGEANSGSQVLPLIGQTNPDLVMLDIRMPQLDGLACLDRIRKSYPKLKVVMHRPRAHQRCTEACTHVPHAGRTRQAEQ
jgi:YesN/AraC family two-component response regulator